MRDFSQLSDAAADVYLRHIISRGPARLQGLALAMRDTCGPIEEMDGSVASLRPLWVWWKSLRANDFHGIEPIVPSITRALSTPDDVWHVKKFPSPHSLEMVEHYFVEVLQRTDQRLKWDTVRRERGKRIQSALMHHTVVPMPNGYPFDLSNSLRIAASSYLHGADDEKRKRHSQDSFLIDMVADLPFDSTAEQVPPANGSILTPLLDLPTIVWEDPMTVSPLETEAEANGEVAAPLPDRAGEETLLIGRGADFEELAAAPPLDETIVAATLNDLGFRTLSGEAVDPVALSEGTHYFERPDLSASIDSEAHDGRLRSLILDPLALTETEWTAIRAVLEKLAVSLDAELRGEGDY